MNKLIKGDCLQVLDTFEDQSIDLALYDPPYNTKTKYEYANNIDKWDEWMRSVLKLTRSKLKKTGSICIHISHHKLFELGILMNEIFGENNKIGIIAWESKFATVNNAKFISSTTEFILVYAKNKNNAYCGYLPRIKDQNDRFNNNIAIDNLSSPSLKCNSLNSQIRPGNKPNIFGIMNPITRKIYYPPSGRCWRRSMTFILNELNKTGLNFYIDGNDIITNTVLDSKVNLDDVFKDSRIIFGNKHQTAPALVIYLSEIAGKGRKMGTYWHFEELCDDSFAMLLPHQCTDHNASATKLLFDIIGRANSFNTPKPLKITEMLVELFCPDNGLVVDSFAGSGTTGHAVISLNHKLKRNRSFTLIEKNEYIETLTYERLKRIITGNWDIGKQEPLGTNSDLPEMFR